VGPAAGGDTFDKDKMGSFTAGSFAYLDPDLHPYAMASREVIVQVQARAAADEPAKSSFWPISRH
jgi:hypothetical protein